MAYLIFMEKFHVKSPISTSFTMSKKNMASFIFGRQEEESFFSTALKFLTIYSMHFLFHRVMWWLFELWAQKRRKSPSLARSLNAKIKWDATFFCALNGRVHLILDFWILTSSLNSMRHKISFYFFLCRKRVLLLIKHLLFYALL